MKIFIKTASVLITLTMLISVCSCTKEELSSRPEEETTISEEFESTEKTTEENTTAEETEEVIAIPEYFNSLTGLGIDKEKAISRPVAVMINNIKAAMPQHGTSKADVIYECIVEGSQTRLMALYSDFEDIGTVGSVRSSREYYLDFAANHDAIYVHAGGSDEAYRQIKKRGTNNLDGVNMYLPNTFYRDKDRLKTHSYEHTLMTTGEKIKDAIEFKGYRVDFDNNFDGYYNFVPYGETSILPSDALSASKVSVVYSPAHSPYYVYDEETGVYTRYQFDAVQKDAESDDALTFTNIVILYCSTYNTGDSYGHYSVDANSGGKGYYVTLGKCLPVTWSESNGKLTLKDSSGNEVMINRGKTMMQICTKQMYDTTVIEDFTA